MNEAVKNVLNNNMWMIATYGNGEPNAVPVAFKTVTDDGRLLVGDVFLETTLANLNENGRIAVSAYNDKMEGYQIKGKAEHVTEGAEFDAMVKTVKSAFGGALDCKGLVIIYPERIIVTTPGADNKKEL